MKNRNYAHNKILTSTKYTVSQAKSEDEEDTQPNSAKDFKSLTPRARNMGRADQGTRVDMKCT